MKKKTKEKKRSLIDKAWEGQVKTQGKDKGKYTIGMKDEIAIKKRKIAEKLGLKKKRKIDPRSREKNSSGRGKPSVSDFKRSWKRRGKNFKNLLKGAKFE